jgi:hypothetical protein
LLLPLRNRKFFAEMKIALAQLDTTVGDLRGNCARVLDFYNRGVAAGADPPLHPHDRNIAG